MVMQTILFLEDDKVINQEISTGLKAGLGNGVQIISAYTISEARQMMQDFKIDLSIVSIELPDGNGIDLAREMRTEDEYMPIMLASLHLTAQLHMELNNELDLFLALKKPFGADEILPRVKRNLQKVKRRQEPSLVLKEGRTRFKIPISTIIKIETIKRKKRIELTIYNNETGSVSLQEFPMQSMEDFMQLLGESKALVRIHQSTVVNPDFVLHYDGAVNELHLKHTKRVLSIGKTYRETTGILFGRLK